MPDQSALPNASPKEKARIGIAGRPFTVGFLGILGAGAGLVVLGGVAALSTVLTYTTIAFFLALAIEPLVTVAARRGIRRGPVVGGVFIVGAAAVAGFGFVAVPEIVRETEALIRRAPSAIAELSKQSWFQPLDISMSRSRVTSTLETFLQSPSHLKTIGEVCYRWEQGLSAGSPESS
ncbi:AI-2E family transporter [Frondihabitans sp. PAMC 28766]|uniref:AI-2E family transporter n=1 Tax=Frondihabitans sp. PAMC 28766 TaxID=1795630 RepID=UPI0012FFC448|nr:AI-2E family transporter [Frondihabitans sp. PAMC 28766]